MFSDFLLRDIAHSKCSIATQLLLTLMKSVNHRNIICSQTSVNIFSLFEWTGTMFKPILQASVTSLFISDEKYCLLWLECVLVQVFINNSKDLPNRKDSLFAWVVTPPLLLSLVLPLLSPFPLLHAGTLGLFYCLLWLYCLGEWSCFQLSQLPTDSNTKTPITLEEENQFTAFLFCWCIREGGDTSDHLASHLEPDNKWIVVRCECTY